MPNDEGTLPKTSTGGGTTLRYFAVCAPGLEPLLVTELQGFGVDAAATLGGVQGRCSTQQLWRVVVASNLAEGVRVRLKDFEARDFHALSKGLSGLPWHAYIRRGQAVAVSVTCRKSKLYHSDAVAERVAAVLQERLGCTRAGRGVEPAQTVYVRLDKDRVTPSVEAAGERLHRRGYRTAVEAAPLRETLASAMARLLDELSPEPISRVWDPFCGSGVLLLEWLRMRLGVLPGQARRFAFQQWPTHTASMETLLGAARSDWVPKATPPTGLSLLGSDVDAKAIQSSLLNADALGRVVGGAIAGASLSWECADFRQMAERVPESYAVICNPPHGRRIGSGRRAHALYDQLDQLLTAREDLRPAVVACAQRDFMSRSQLPWRRLVRTRQGGLDLEFLGLS